MKRRTIILATTAALLLLSGVAFTMRPGKDGIAPVKRGDVFREIVSPGVVESATDQVALAFETAGRIVEIAVDEGDRVHAGDVVARLDGRLQAARVARAEAALEAANARRDAAIRGSRGEEIRAAEAEADAAEATARERDSWRARAEKLAGTNAVTASELDSAKSAADSARALARAADARRALTREGARTELRREAIAAAAAARAELDEARTLLDQTMLRAPRDGVIIRRFAEPGEYVSTMPAKAVLTLADLEHVEVRVEVDETNVGRVVIGQSAYATADAYGPKRFPGHIVRRTGELGRKTLRADDPRGRSDTRVLEVMFAPDGGALDLPLGLRMDVHIETVAEHGVLIVPLAALRFEGERARAVVLEDGHDLEREVQVGASDGLVAEVTSGLREGELVRMR